MSRTQGIERSEIDDLMIMQTALGLLNELNEEDVDWIFRTGFERQVAANTVIVREGEPLACLYIVLEGLFGAQFYRALAILNSRRVRERVSSLTTSFLAKLDATSLSGETSKTFFSAIERFKSLLIQADGEALKGGGQVPEATALTAERAFLDF